MSGRCTAEKKTGPNPTDRRKKGSKHHIISDAQGTPLAVLLTAANVNDVSELMPLVHAIPAIRGKRGRPRSRPERVQGDRGYDSNPYRQQLKQMGIEPVLARRRTPHGSGLGKTRWVIERTIALMHQFRRLRHRYEKRPELHEAFMSLAASLLCWNRLKRP